MGSGSSMKHKLYSCNKFSERNNIRCSKNKKEIQKVISFGEFPTMVSTSIASVIYSQCKLPQSAISCHSKTTFHEICIYILICRAMIRINFLVPNYLVYFDLR